MAFEILDKVIYKTTHYLVIGDNGVEYSVKCNEDDFLDYWSIWTDEDGNIEWYGVEFSDGPRKVFTEKLEVMVAEYHGNHKKKKRTIG